MNKGQSLAWGRTILVLSALVFSQVYLSSAFARSNGSITSEDNCSDCHSLDATTVMILGPEQVAAHSTNAYTFTIIGDGAGGSPDVWGGLDVATLDGGVLGLIDAVNEGTQLTTDGTSGLDEVTHTGRKGFLSGSVSWLFSWTAPGVLGSYDLFGQGVNADGSGTGGDFTGMTTFTVQVVPIPAAAVLFGSALGVLGWVRRRVA